MAKLNKTSAGKVGRITSFVKTPSSSIPNSIGANTSKANQLYGVIKNAVVSKATTAANTSKSSTFSIKDLLAPAFIMVLFGGKSLFFFCLFWIFFFFVPLFFFLFWQFFFFIKFHFFSIYIYQLETVVFAREPVETETEQVNNYVDLGFGVGEKFIMTEKTPFVEPSISVAVSEEETVAPSTTTESTPESTTTPIAIPTIPTSNATSEATIAALADKIVSLVSCLLFLVFFFFF